MSNFILNQDIDKAGTKFYLFRKFLTELVKKNYLNVWRVY